MSSMWKTTPNAHTRAHWIDGTLQTGMVWYGMVWFERKTDNGVSLEMAHTMHKATHSEIVALAFN